MSYVDDLITIIQNNWNETPVPTVARITSVTRVNYRDDDYILVYEYDWIDKKKGFRYDFVSQRNVISFDIRTNKDYQTLKLLESEFKRILHAYRKAPVSNFDYLNIIRREDLSITAVRIYRIVFDIELIDRTEVI